MKGILSLALLVAITTKATSATRGGASATEISNNNHHREKREIPDGPQPLKSKKLLPLLALLGSGGSGADPLPPHVDPNIGQSSAQINSIQTSMSGPLATMGVLAILTSALMAANYFQAVNAKRRKGYSGPHFQKRSSFDINPDSIVSLINSFR